MQKDAAVVFQSMLSVFTKLHADEREELKKSLPEELQKLLKDAE